MKKILLFICAIIIGLYGFSQEGEQHKIVEIFDLEKVRINVGSEIDIQVGDIFQVFGKGQVIHPATGKLIVRENVFLGKIEVTEVIELSSTAKVLESERQFAIGNKIVKVFSAEQEIIVEKKPVQGEFQNPSKRDYSETIYAVNSKEKKTYPQITEISEKDGNLIATIDKGSAIKGKGGKLKTGKKYYINVPINDNVIDFSRIGKQRVIGEVRLIDVEHLNSHGLLKLYVKKSVLQNNINDNVLKTFISKEGWYFSATISIFEIDYESNFFGSIRSEYGYQINPHLALGLGFRMYNQYLDVSDSSGHMKFFTIPIFANLTYDIINKRHSPVVALRYGFANIFDKQLRQVSTYSVQGGSYAALSIYYRFYLKKDMALIFGVEGEGCVRIVKENGNELHRKSFKRFNIFVGIKL